MGRDKIHGDEPLAEGYLRILEDGSNKDGEIGIAMAAVEAAIGAAYATVLTAEGAYNVMFLPTGFVDGLAAFVLRREVIGEFEDRVEASEVNHKAQVSRCICYYIP